MVALPALQLKLALEELKVDPGAGFNICTDWAASSPGEKSARPSSANRIRGVITECVSYQVPQLRTSQKHPVAPHPRLPIKWKTRRLQLACQYQAISGILALPCAGQFRRLPA